MPTVGGQKFPYTPSGIKGAIKAQGKQVGTAARETVIGSQILGNAVKDSVIKPQVKAIGKIARRTTDGYMIKYK